MTSDLTFLPNLRRGVIRAVTVVDPLSGPFTTTPMVQAWVEVEGRRVARDVQLGSADDVSGLSVGQVLRSEPRPDSTDVEPNYFPLVEVAAPDLPWLMTPAQPDGSGRLRPWLVLVVIRRQDGVTITDRSRTELKVLTIEDPAVPGDELPDLDESWGWAHVHSQVPEAEVAAAVEQGDPGVIARLVCPRRLVTDTRYVACLVPALAGAVARGLGEPPDPDAVPTPAWDAGDWPARIELPVYHHWSFTTGARGDFEALARRLRPDDQHGEMGLHAMDVGRPGVVEPVPRPVLVDMEGALVTLGATPRPWPPPHRQHFQGQLAPVVEAAITQPDAAVAIDGDYDPARDDPMLTPPAWGAGPAGIDQLPATGWVPEVNLSPVARGAAGLGAAVVRANQEELVAAAWDQAGDLHTAMTVVSHGRLAAEVGESWARRVRALPDADVLQVTRTLHPLLPDNGGSSVRGELVHSDAPTGTFSAAFLRQTRPGATLARDWRNRSGLTDARLTADHAAVVLTATDPAAPADLRAALHFADYRIPNGAQTSDATLQHGLTTLPVPTADGRPVIGLSDEVAHQHELIVRQRLGLAMDVPAMQTQAPIPKSVTQMGPAHPLARVPVSTVASIVDVSSIGDVVRAALAPHQAVASSMVARMPTLAPYVGDHVPSRLVVAPSFPDALYWDLLDLSAEWILPGVNALGRNRMRLVAVNTDFVGAFLIGANTELVRELRWRDYPIDPTSTAFHRFWEYVLDRDRVDIDDLDSWEVEASMADNMAGAGDPMTAIVVRGDLVHRYPDAHWFLRKARDDGEGGWEPGGSPVEVSFLGSLDAQTAVYGFDVEPDDVRGDRPTGVGGYYVGVEERLGAPRFGLDTAKPKHFDQEPVDWDEASWGHLVTSRDELDVLTHAPVAGRLDGLDRGGTIWGHNAAHMAAATWQRPFRLLIHADMVI